MLALLALVSVATAFPGCGRAPGRGPLPASYWVWNRDEPLNAAEQRSLQTAGVRRLFWQVGELEMQGPGLGWKEQHPLPKDTATIHFVPTLRVHASAASPSLWGNSLIADMEAFKECQLDFDCKTGRLAEYQAALHRVRTALPGRRLSITALAHWPQAAHWRELMQEVDEVFPMFYDLEPDPSLAPGKRPRPMVDMEAVVKWTKAWMPCPVPWHLGLPNMTRLTVFDQSGARHLRSWDQGTLSSLGAPVLRDDESLTLWQLSEAGHFTALRRPSLPDLKTAMTAGSGAGASGVIWFSLTQPGRAASGWSVAHLQHLQAGPTTGPAFAFTTTKVEGGHKLLLTNTGDQDAIDDFKGCLLRLKVRRGEVREVLAGGFAGLSFLADGAQVAEPREADEIRLFFSRLDAGEQIATDLVRFSWSGPSPSLSWSVESATMKTVIAAQAISR